MLIKAIFETHLEHHIAALSINLFIQTLNRNHLRQTPETREKSMPRENPMAHCILG